ncbi:MAG TPA: sigma-54 dependent transcriptional regulator [Longimicrobiaceae bacterium]
MPSILIVDDEANLRRMIASVLRAEGYVVREADSGRAGLAAVQAEAPDVMLLDLVMPGGTGLETLPDLRSAAPDLPIIMMSGKASLSDAVRATKLGAFHFLEKPLSPDALLLTVRSALELRQARALNEALREELGADDELVGSSETMQQVRELIERVAATDARVLITGESGTGKELAASAIHRLSPRAAKPFIRVNCAAIPRDLVESELFGHERGAFTGATERRRGRFELADGGTLLLDEVGDLGAEAQAKLLRVLETGEFERVGGSTPLRVDVRTLAATNRDLRADVAAGRFREDLFFRLHVIPLHLPPLRERREDVPELVSHLLERQRSRIALRPPRLTPAALNALQRHSWPGNVRELANIVERLTILHSGAEVGADEVRALLDPSPTTSSDGAGYADDESLSLTDRLDAFERQVIQRALDRAGGNVAEAARQLHTDRGNLYRRMRRLRIDR